MKINANIVETLDSGVEIFYLGAIHAGTYRIISLANYILSTDLHLLISRSIVQGTFSSCHSFHAPAIYLYPAARVAYGL